MEINLRERFIASEPNFPTPPVRGSTGSAVELARARHRWPAASGAPAARRAPRLVRWALVRDVDGPGHAGMEAADVVDPAGLRGRELEAGAGLEGLAVEGAVVRGR